jgi:c-di-GMP-binding flagellar brake protein YcgR
MRSMEKQEDGEDRRRFFRLNKIMPAHFIPISAEDGPMPSEDPAQRDRIFVVDISAGGFRATTHKPMQVDAKLHAEIYISRTDPIRGDCRVVWQRELTVSEMFEVGLEFTDLPQEEWKRLVDFIVEERARSLRPTKVTWEFEKGYLNRPMGG